MEPLPQCSPKASPGKWNPSPQQEAIPSRFWKLTPAEHERVSRTFYSKVISPPGYNWVILSQLPRKDRPWRSLPVPSGVHPIFQQRSTMVSPAELSSNLSEVPLFPHRVTPRKVIYTPSLFPNGVIFSYRYSCNHHPQRK